MLRNARWSVFLKLDLDSTAGFYADSPHALSATPVLEADHPDPLGLVHEHMFRAAVRRLRGDAVWEEDEERAFARLGEIIIREATQNRVLPRCTVQEDQIVWGRSPVRLDLAGGWSDTPPYCLENGGSVLNVAVDLNGQPPIQVYARRSAEPRIVLRSIDLGAEEQVTTYEELERHADPGSGFSVARAALALAGFVPRFRGAQAPGTLTAALEEFGGGIELSLLAAVPKGSGLGTSSILAATVLGTLSDLCGLGWDRHALFGRTMALEQMLTTGGGWQDQGGGIFRGTKLIETAPGLDQSPTLRWVPDHLLEGAIADQAALLYYTGITRMAKNILGEIVRGIFLNSPAHLGLIDEIARNAGSAFDGLQRGDYERLARSVRTSWELNQRLDAGTNPPPVAAILEQVGDWLAAAKLLGAGGGGFLLMLAKDPEAARRIRACLTDRPPNARARFVNFTVSPTGLHITRS
jgi:galactokinase/mevalonate kinase-like predicted kinase